METDYVRRSFPDALRQCASTLSSPWIKNGGYSIHLALIRGSSLSRCARRSSRQVTSTRSHSTAMVSCCGGGRTPDAHAGDGCPGRDQRVPSPARMTRLTALADVAALAVRKANNGSVRGLGVEITLGSLLAAAIQAPVSRVVACPVATDWRSGPLGLEAGPAVISSTQHWSLSARSDSIPLAEHEVPAWVCGASGLSPIPAKVASASNG